MTYTTVVAILTLPVLLAITVGCAMLRRALAQPKLLPEEFALAAAWVFVVGSLVWLGRSNIVPELKKQPNKSPQTMGEAK